MKYEDVDLRSYDVIGANHTADEQKINMEFWEVDTNKMVQQTLNSFYELGIFTVTDMDSYECTIEKDEDDSFYVKVWTNDVGWNGHEFDFIASNDIILKFVIPKFISAIKSAEFYDAD